MKKIEDYLHLYLGCECQYLMLGRGVLSEVSLDSKYGVLASVKLNGTKKHIQTTLSSLKLILRPLSSMSEYERCYGVPVGDTIIVNAAMTAFLLSKHFDLFSLIESGLAIDATTLSPLKVNQ